MSVTFLRLLWFFNYLMLINILFHCLSFEVFTLSSYKLICPLASLLGCVLISLHSVFLSLYVSQTPISYLVFFSLISASLWLSVCLWLGFNQPSRLSLLGLNNIPWLACTKFDCTVTSEAPEPADWLLLGAGGWEYGRGTLCGLRRRESWWEKERLSDAAQCLKALSRSFCCPHFEFLSSSISTRLQLLIWWKLQHSNIPLLTVN